MAFDHIGLPKDIEPLQGGHEPITVFNRGFDDLLLMALRREHGWDDRRDADDMTERLEKIRRAILQSNKHVKPEECAA